MTVSPDTFSFLEMMHEMWNEWLHLQQVIYISLVSIPNHESIGQFSTHHTPFFGFDRFGPLLFTRSGEIALRFLSLRCRGIGVMECGWTAFLLFWIYETAFTSNANSSSRRRIRVSMLDRIVSIALWSSFLTTSYWKQSGSVYCG